MTNTDGARRLSRRQRQLLWTATLVAAGLLVCALAAVALYRSRQPTQYTPGEAIAEITESLSKDLPSEAPKPALVDVTKEAGLADFVTFAGARSSQLPEDMGPGAAWGDYDNDGDDDLFLVSAGGTLSLPSEQRAPSALFENLGDGRFRRVADFPEPRIIGMGAAWGDANSDGWLDLVVTGFDALLLFRNDRGRLTLDSRFASRKGFWASANWGDYDNDGDLDLYVCGYVKYVPTDTDRARVTEQYGTAVPFTLNPASFEPEQNLLFRNKGDGTLVEVARTLGVSDPEGRSLSALWLDFDKDGWLDLYVANDISDNKFFHNVRGRFEEIGTAAWVADYRGAMGLAAGDWNRDGDDDLFITHWLAQENALYDSLFGDTGALRFVDAADTLGLGQIALPMVGWGTEFADFDGDGWLDLAVANGSTLETDDMPRRLKPQQAFLFWNRRGEHFHDLAPLAAPLAQPQVARGLAVSDFDNDGDVDILIARNGGGVQLLRNDMQKGHWAEVRLRTPSKGGGPVRVATGAQAVAHVGSVQLRRTVASASYLSQSSTTLHFGLGDATAIEKLEVRWRDGSVSTFNGLAADRVWEITQGEAAPREFVRGALPADAGSPPGAPAAPGTAGGTTTERERLVAFWDRHRGGMHALKVERDLPKAIALFREALAIDPAHEDARYYLGNCLAEQGDVAGALAEYERLTEVNPKSHRGFARGGTLRANTARSAADLAAAEEALEKAYRINPEETGALLTLAEVALLRRRTDVAEQRLTSVCQMNPRSVGGLFLLGYVHWTRGDAAGAKAYLERTRAALGPDWKPIGATAEGDVAKKAHSEVSPLSRFWDRWDGSVDPARAYKPLAAHLETAPR